MVHNELMIIDVPDYTNNTIFSRTISCSSAAYKFFEVNINYFVIIIYIGRNIKYLLEWFGFKK